MPFLFRSDSPLISPVPQDSLIEVESVSFAYARRPILKGVSMRVPRGKVVAIMGASGSGKTTLLRIIGGQLAPTSGSVRFDGEDVHSLQREALYRMRRRMSMLFQFGALFTEFTLHPPIWVTLIIWMPMTLVVCLALLRPFKGMMLAAQFMNKASEARHDD